MLRGARSRRRHPGQPRAARRVVRGQCRRARLPGRPQRRRQDHDVPHHHGISQAGRGRDRVRRPAPSSGCGRIEIARMGIGFAPEESEVFGELTVAENIALPTWTLPERARRRGAHRGRLSRVSRGSSAIASAAATRSPAASARWSRSPARWRSDPSCCCSTSRPRGFRRPSCRRSSRGSLNIRASATRCSSPNRTSTTCPSSPTGSMSSSAARSSSPARRTRPRKDPARGADHRGNRGCARAG